MPFCAARALRDNGAGRLVFVDPSYSGVGDPGWDGEGAWGDAAAVAEWIADFGLADWMTHVKATSAEAFPQVAELVRGGTVGIVIIDGAHTFENSLQDFELYSSLVGDGFVLFHDSTNPSCAVSSTVRALAAEGYPLVTIDRDAGLTIVSVSGGGSVEAHWSYLSAPSNRAARILPYARSILRPGDRVLDVYCGCAPLASLLDDVEIFGCDRDPAIVRMLRAELPQHRWEVIEESWLPFAGKLPDAVDVIVGLGVSRGRAAWDPQFVAENTCYLLGRYLPRACLFETAADYYDAEILADLELILGRLGYECRVGVVETDMASFSRRKVLLAERRLPRPS